MGESIMNSSAFEDKEAVVETASSNAALEVSVSFGRFEKDSLSWERFSAFSPNKYLEEVGKCATPGSVAEKRAYFEAHYKKIAARKAELMEQEKQMEDDNMRSPHDQKTGDMDVNSFRTDCCYDASNSQNSDEAAEQEMSWVSEIGEAIGDDDSTTVEGQEPDSPRFDGSEKVGMLREEETEAVHIIESKDTNGLPQNSECEMRNFKKTKDENVKPDRPKASRKVVAALNKEKVFPGIKKKPASPSPITETPKFSSPRPSNLAPAKSQQVSTPRASKPAPTKTSQFSTPRVSKPTPSRTPTFSSPNVMTASRPSVKKESRASVPRKKNPSVGEIKSVTPKSLHMSLSIDPTTPVCSDPTSLTTVRKSLIMERMGDKDIVKRAFKSFQNNFNQLRSFSEERSSMLEQVSPRGTDAVRVSGTVNTRKENGGSTGVSGAEKRSAKAAPAFGSRSNERVPKHKEFSKKSDEKTNTMAERTRVQTKSKEQKEAEMKKLTRSLDLKANPMSGLHRGKKISTAPFH